MKPSTQGQTRGPRQTLIDETTADACTDQSRFITDEAPKTVTAH
jgi:hypothetical protein